MDLEQRLKQLIDDLMLKRNESVKGLKALSKYHKGYSDGLKEAHYLLFCLWLEYRNYQSKNTNDRGN